MSDRALAASVQFSPTVFVFESVPWWEPELQRQFEGRQITVRGCRSISDLHELVRCTPVAVVVADLGAAPAELLLWLGSLIRERLEPHVIVVAPGELISLEWTLRELGASCVVDEFVGGKPLALLCERQCREWSVES